MVRPKTFPPGFLSNADAGVSTVTDSSPGVEGFAGPWEAITIFAPAGGTFVAGTITLRVIEFEQGIHPITPFLALGDVLDLSGDANFVPFNVFMMPEPATASLLGFGLVGLAAVRSRRRRG